MLAFSVTKGMQWVQIEPELTTRCYFDCFVAAAIF